MAKKIINPFQNESESLQIGDLTIENRVDRVSIYGSIDLTLDKEGLAKARQLKEILALTLAELEKAPLPDRISLAPADTVDNPFA
jgi:hypothetical protein